MSPGSFKNGTYKLFAYNSYIWYICIKGIYYQKSWYVIEHNQTNQQGLVTATFLS